MKGKLAIGTVVALVIAIIVVAIAIYFLVFVNPFDPYFLDPAKYKLIRYATCSLALCANGVSSDGAASKQIDNVGCLEYEGGRCVKTCNDIKSDFVTNNHQYKQDNPIGERHYCDESNTIEFEIEPSFPINLRGEEIQKLSNTKWVCRGISIFGEFVDLTDEVEAANGGCIMYGSLEGPLTAIGVKENFEEAKGKGCFRSLGSWQFQKVVFTPLMPYSEIAKISAIDSDASHYPSALYIKNQLITGSNSECEISNNGPVLEKGGQKTEINTISQCKIKTVDEKGRRVFKVWSEGRRNLPIEKGVIGGNGENCASVILDTGVANYPFTPGKTLSSSREQIFPALVASNGKLYLFFQDADSVNQQAGVFTASGRDSTIVYATSSDGSFASFQGTPIPNLFPYEAVAKVLQPSATLLNGHKYLAYSTNLAKGETYDIMVKDLDGGANLQGAQPERATDDKVDQFYPSIAASSDKLYLFYEQDLPNLPSEIYYKVGTVTGDRVKWSEAKLFGVSWQRPSVAPVPDGLMITYSFKCDASSPLNGKPRFGQAGKPAKSAASAKSAAACENGVGAAIFKNDEFQDAGIVESGSETYGISRPIAIGSDIFVFFDRGGESKRIFYSKYLGEVKWQESSPAVPYSSRSQVMPSLAEFGGGLTLAFSELGDNYDIRVSSLKGDLAGSSPPVASPPQQSGGQETAKSLTVTSDKKEYERTEMVKFNGQLTGAKEGDNVRLELSAVREILGKFFVTSEEVATDKDGKFSWEFKPDPTSTEKSYEIVASSGSLDAKYQFTVK